MHQTLSCLACRTANPCAAQRKQRRCSNDLTTLQLYVYLDTAQGKQLCCSEQTAVMLGALTTVCREYASKPRS